MVSFIKEKTGEWKMFEDEVRSFAVKYNLVMTNRKIHMYDDMVVQRMVSTKGNLDEHKNFML